MLFFLLRTNKKQQKKTIFFERWVEIIFGKKSSEICCISGVAAPTPGISGLRIQIFAGRVSCAIYLFHVYIYIYIFFENEHLAFQRFVLLLPFRYFDTVSAISVVSADQNMAPCEVQYRQNGPQMYVILRVKIAPANTKINKSPNICIYVFIHLSSKSIYLFQIYIYIYFL